MHKKRFGQVLYECPRHFYRVRLPQRPLKSCVRPQLFLRLRPVLVRRPEIGELGEEVVVWPLEGRGNGRSGVRESEEGQSSNQEPPPLHVRGRGHEHWREKGEGEGEDGNKVPCGTHRDREISRHAAQESGHDEGASADGEGCKSKDRYAEARRMDLWLLGWSPECGLRSREQAAVGQDQL